jgi:hypothetical protein
METFPGRENNNMKLKAMESVSVQTVVRLLIILSGVAVLSGCACYHARFGPPTVVVAETQMKVLVEPDFEILLNAIPSNLVIKGSNNDYAEASMEVRCPDISGSCADHFAGLEFDTRREGNKIRISANRGPLINGIFYGGNSAVKTMLALPRVEHLKVNMFAGNAKIYGIDVNRLDVKVYAGDVNIVIPENIVAEFDLDAGVGDVSIRSPVGFRYAPRSFLVGSELKKLISNEGATVKVDVQFGNIRLNLTP